MVAKVTFPEGKNQIKARIYNTKQKGLNNALSQYMQKEAKTLEDYMKSHRPWTDRTGNARRGLKATIDKSTAGYRQSIELSHSVSYGVYLEYSMGKRFAILEPTIRIEGPRVVRDLQNFMSQVF